MEGGGEHIRGDGAVRGDEAEHGAHVGADHAGAFADGAQADDLAADGGLYRNLLHDGVGGHDGFRSGLGAADAQGGGQSGNAVLDGLDVQLHADDAGGGYSEILGLTAGDGGCGGAHGFCVFRTIGSAGVGVAGVDDDAMEDAVLQVVHGGVDGCSFHPIVGKGGGGGTLTVGEDQRQVVLVRAAASLYASVDASGSETLCGADAAGNLFHIAISFVGS